MDVSSPSTLLKFLNKYNLKPKKRFSQNFLIDSHVLEKVVQLADLSKEDTVIEIGPGPGALTHHLLETGCHVIAIEKDPDFAHALQRFENPRLQIHCADALEFPFDSLKGSYKVVANLPYQITTPILARLMTYNSIFSRIIVMVQDEVGKRMTAQPRCREYGSLTVFLSYYSELYYGLRVKNHSFYPKPKVDSAIIRLDLKEQLPLKDPSLFFQVTRKAFQHKRKMLRGSLRALFPLNQILEGLDATSLPNTSRPEELSLEQFLELYKNLSKNNQ